MQVKDVMRTPVHLIGPDALLVAAARRMRDENVGSLPVGEGAELLGMITDRDIVVRCVAEGEDCVKTAVRDAMSAELLCCFLDQPVEEAARLMDEYRVRPPAGARPPPTVGRDRVAYRPVRPGREHAAPPGGILQGADDQRLRSAAPRAVTVVYIAGRQARDEVEAAAIRKFERDRGGRPWRAVADGYEIVEPE